MTVAVLVAVHCGCVNWVAVLICQGHFTDVSNKLAGTS